MLILQSLLRFKKTLSRSQTHFIKGVSITQNQCNPNAYGSLGLNVKLLIYDNFPQKRLSLPIKLPNEF